MVLQFLPGEFKGVILLRYHREFDDLAGDNTHVSAIVLFRFSEGEAGEFLLNNYIVTAYQKEIG